MFLSEARCIAKVGSSGEFSCSFSRSAWILFLPASPSDADPGFSRYVYRVAALEDTIPTLGADLWDLESKRVKALVARAEAAEKEAEAEARKKDTASKTATAGPSI